MTGGAFITPIALPMVTVGEKLKQHGFICPCHAPRRRKRPKWRTPRFLMDSRTPPGNDNTDPNTSSLSSLLAALASRLEQSTSEQQSAPPPKPSDDVRTATATEENCNEEVEVAPTLQALLSMLRSRIDSASVPSDISEARGGQPPSVRAEKENDSEQQSDGLTSTPLEESLPSLLSTLSTRLSASIGPNGDSAVDSESGQQATAPAKLAAEAEGAKASNQSDAGEGLSVSSVLGALGQRLSEYVKERAEDRDETKGPNQLQSEAKPIDAISDDNVEQDASQMSLTALVAAIGEKIATVVPSEREEARDEAKFQLPTESSGQGLAEEQGKSDSNGLTLSSVLAALRARKDRMGPDNQSIQSPASAEPIGDETAKKARSGLLRRGPKPEEKTSPMLLSLVSSLGARVEEATTLNVQSVLQNLEDAKTDISEQAMLATMRALGVEPLDSQKVADEIPLPQRPFDPVLGLVLAIYSFSAYRSPPKNSYRETFSSRVRGSEISGLRDQIVHTEFVYPDTAVISKRANGLFMLQVISAEGLDDKFITAEVNGSVVLDIVRKGHSSVLRLRDAPATGIRKMLHRKTDHLKLSLYESAKAYDVGLNPTHVTSVSLSDIVQQGLELNSVIDGDINHLTFEKVSEEEKNIDFFQFSLLPREMKLPFQGRLKGNGVGERKSEPLRSSVISLQATFVPFAGRSSEPSKKALRDSDRGRKGEAKSLTQSSVAPLEDELDSVLSRELSPGSIPDMQDWTRMAGVVRALLHDEGSRFSIPRTSTVTENLPGSLFLESLSTDTEVWLFHDDTNKDVVISFRGTEQVSWKDFFTDAQIFLQKWAPGDEINLDVDLSTTVGLADLVPSILPAATATIPADASAVHYGFLRAYLSIRDGLLRAISMLSSELADGYSFHFTGHSLGGALAIIAAADFQARHMFDNHDVSCMSYGAPKVGNMHFAKLFNELVPNSFRIVNDADLVARMPRSLYGSSTLSRYKHAGRTVLVNNDGEYWIEGGSDMSWNGVLTTVADPFRERYKDLQDLVAFEQKLWSQLVSGESVQHHMEDSYFVAMQRVLKRFTEEQSV